MCIPGFRLRTIRSRQPSLPFSHKSIYHDFVVQGTATTHKCILYCSTGSTRRCRTTLLKAQMISSDQNESMQQERIATYTILSTSIRPPLPSPLTAAPINRQSDIDLDPLYPRRDPSRPRAVQSDLLEPPLPLLPPTPLTLHNALEHDDPLPRLLH